MKLDASQPLHSDMGGSSGEYIFVRKCRFCTSREMVRFFMANAPIWIYVRMYLTAHR